MVCQECLDPAPYIWTEPKKPLSCMSCVCGAKKEWWNLFQIRELELICIVLSAFIFLVIMPTSQPYSLHEYFHKFVLFQFILQFCITHSPPKFSFQKSIMMESEEDQAQKQLTPDNNSDKSKSEKVEFVISIKYEYLYCHGMLRIFKSQHSSNLQIFWMFSILIGHTPFDLLYWGMCTNVCNSWWIVDYISTSFKV